MTKIKLIPDASVNFIAPSAPVKSGYKSNGHRKNAGIKTESSPRTGRLPCCDCRNGRNSAPFVRIGLNGESSALPIETIFAQIAVKLLTCGKNYHSSQ